MDDLVQWLRAQFDVEEQVAREATSGPWRNAPTARHHATVSGRSEEAVFGSTPENGLTVVATTGEAAERRHLVDAEHIAAWDPARVLREIGAKRQLLAKYNKAVDRMEELTALCKRLKAEGKDTFMPDMERMTAIHRRDVLGEVLRLLALPYADRPGYREEWRP